MKIKLEWDSPFRDENQIVDYLCSGQIKAVGEVEKRLLLGQNDVSIQVIHSLSWKCRLCCVGKIISKICRPDMLATWGLS